MGLQTYCRRNQSSGLDHDITITVIPGLTLELSIGSSLGSSWAEQRIADRQCKLHHRKQFISVTGLPGFTMMWYPVIKLSTSSVWAATDALWIE